VSFICVLVSSCPPACLNFKHNLKQAFSCDRRQCWNSTGHKSRHEARAMVFATWQTLAWPPTGSIRTDGQNRRDGRTAQS